MVFNFVLWGHKHTDNGKQIFKNFLFSICKIKKRWNVISQKKILVDYIKKKVGKDKVICALSGGVDSSVVALLIHKAIKKKLNLYYGRHRTYEKKMNLNIHTKFLKQKYKLNVKLINASQLFIKKLKNVYDPEKKKKLLVDYL